MEEVIKHRDTLVQDIKNIIDTVELSFWEKIVLIYEMLLQDHEYYYFTSDLDENDKSFHAYYKRLKPELLAEKVHDFIELVQLEDPNVDPENLTENTIDYIYYHNGRTVMLRDFPLRAVVIEMVRAGLLEVVDYKDSNDITFKYHKEVQYQN